MNQDVPPPLQPNQTVPTAAAESPVASSAPVAATPPPPPTKKNFPVKTLLLIVVLFLIAGGLIAFALMPKTPTQQQAIVPTPTIDPVQTTLTISSTPVALATPSSYKADIVINTGQDKVNKVQLELSYDPTVLTKVDISAGSFISNPNILIKNVDQKNGRITFALETNSNDEALGQGILATLTFTSFVNPKSPTTQVSFLPKTEVRSPDYPASVLKSTVGAVFNLGALPVLTPTPKTSTQSAK